ncbi:MAG TPA: PilZ domain-containing protein [Blastocatellia bacterium]|nr:PilZ domain-containing protein [Blastocatellia bacterium]
MKVTEIASEHFSIEFEDEAEFKVEYDNNISAGGLFFQTSSQLPEFTPLQLTLKLAEGGQMMVPATVVRSMGGALGVSLQQPPELIWSTLTAKIPEQTQDASHVEQSAWDKIRNLSRIEKLLLAPKADRSDRQVLIQDNDAQVIFSLLKNPRITTEEVIRIARSPMLSTVAAELIAKTTVWAGNSEIRAALVHNPRTPTPLAVKLLPTLPEPEIRQIAKSGGVSQTLKQAALRIVINRR